MSYTVDYKNEKDARTKAIDDCKFWLGDNYQKMEDAIVKDLLEEEELTDNLVQILTFHLSFVGIQGYPARVLAEYFFEKARELRTEKAE